MPWCLASPGEIYDNAERSVVYYEPRSGDTHLLSEFAAFLIRELATGDKTTDELLQCLAPLTDETDAEQLAASIEAALAELVSLDILRRG